MSGVPLDAAALAEPRCETFPRERRPAPKSSFPDVQPIAPDVRPTADAVSEQHPVCGMIAAGRSGTTDSARPTSGGPYSC